METKEYVKADQRCFVFKLVEAGDGGREEHFIKKEKFKTFTMSCMP
jgi:hypothetical protein